MSDAVKDELLRLSLRRELSSDDEMRVAAVLAAHPEWRPLWEENRSIGRALRSLPDIPVSSNFTAGVLQALDREESQVAREARTRFEWSDWKKVFVPRVSWAAIALIAAVLVFIQVNTEKKQELATTVRDVAGELAILPDPTILQDFDAINQFRQVSYVSDDELLTALQ